MKKAIKIILYILIPTILISAALLCTIVLPNITSASFAHRKYAKTAIEIADNYLDKKTDATSAYFDIDSLVDTEDDLPFSDDMNDFDIEVSVIELSYALSDNDYYETLTIRNELAELIGEKER